MKWVGDIASLSTFSFDMHWFKSPSPEASATGELLGVLENLVPGARVYAHPSSRATFRKRSRWRDFIEEAGALQTPVLELVDRVYVRVPEHGTVITHAWLADAGAQFDADYGRWDRPFAADQLGLSPSHRWERPSMLEDEAWREWLVDRGDELIRRFVASGDLKQWVADEAHAFQRRQAALAYLTRCTFNVWSPGSGKTLGAFISMACRPGGVVIICPAAVRYRVWVAQLARFTHWEGHALTPRSMRKATDESMADYLERKRLAGEKAVVSAAWESLPDYVDELKQFSAEVLVIDEVHLFKSYERWKMTVPRGGGKQFSRKRAASGMRVKRAVALADISQMPSLTLRVGQTATSMGKGRPRDKGAPLDLIDPFQWGGKRAFNSRWAGRSERVIHTDRGPVTIVEDDGASHLDELAERVRWVLHEVPYAEARQGMPDLTVSVTWLDQGECYSRPDVKKSDVLKAGADGDDNPGGDLVWKRAYSAAMTRKYVLSKVTDLVDGGARVVIQTELISDAYVWERKLSKAVDGPVYCASGDKGVKERDDILDQFLAGDPGVLIITTAMGTGVDGLQVVDYAFIVMLPWGPDDLIQRIGRYDRHGPDAVPTTVEIVLAKGTYAQVQVGNFVKQVKNTRKLFAMGEADNFADQLLGADAGTDEDKQAGRAAALFAAVEEATLLDDDLDLSDFLEDA